MHGLFLKIKSCRLFLKWWVFIFQSFIHASYPNLICNSSLDPYVFVCKKMDPKTENVEIDNNNQEFINRNENMFNIGSFNFI